MGYRKGTSIENTKAYLEERVGAGAWDTLLGTLSAKDREVLAGFVPEGWYENALHARMNRAFCEVFYHGDLSAAEELGRYSAERDVTVVRRPAHRLTEPAIALRHMNVYWRQEEDTGRWELDIRREEILAKLVDWQVCDIILCRRLLGYIGRALEFHGSVRLHGHELCRARGDDVCLFSFHWQPSGESEINQRALSQEDIVEILQELRELPDLDSLANALMNLLHFRLAFPYVELWLRPSESETSILMRRAGERSGAPLVLLVLQHAGRNVGRLEVELAPRSQQRHLEAFLPWFSPLLEIARLAMRDGAPARSFEQRIADACARWTLTPRETEVLKLALRGEPNKSIAPLLKCEERTVEQHMTRLLKKSGARSRSMLSWMFWMQL